MTEETGEGYFSDLGHAWREAAIEVALNAPCRRCGVSYVDYTGEECPGSRPLHRRGEFAVYDRGDHFHVMRYGGDRTEPYRTTDLDLARQTCDRWASEFTERS